MNACKDDNNKYGKNLVYLEILGIMVRVNCFLILVINIILFFMNNEVLIY